MPNLNYKPDSLASTCCNPTPKEPNIADIASRNRDVIREVRALVMDVRALLTNDRDNLPDDQAPDCLLTELLIQKDILQDIVVQLRCSLDTLRG